MPPAYAIYLWCWILAPFLWYIFMSNKFGVIWSNNSTFTRPMSKHTFRLRELGMPSFTNATVHVDQVTILFRPTTGDGAISASEYVAPDTADYPWHVETDHLMLRCQPGVRHVLYVGDDPNHGNSASQRADDHGMDARPVQRVCTYSSALSTTPNHVEDESYWCRTYRPIRDLPVLCPDMATDLSEWTLELFFPMILGDSRTKGSQVPDYRIHKVYCEFSLHR